MCVASASPKIWFGASFDKVLSQRKAEADEFYDVCIPTSLSADRKLISRQAYAGLLWSKQFYHYVVDAWIEGDSTSVPLHPNRESGRNHDWRHLFNRDVISMPDKWEYPWYAAWDLAFHMLPMAQVDLNFARDQLFLFLREWNMNRNLLLPGYALCVSGGTPAGQ